MWMYRYICIKGKLSHSSFSLTLHQEKSLIFPEPFFTYVSSQSLTQLVENRTPVTSKKKRKKKDQSASVDVSVLLLLCSSYLSLFIVCWIQLDQQCTPL
jgi:hypothetical protein